MTPPEGRAPPQRSDVGDRAVLIRVENAPLSLARHLPARPTSWLRPFLDLAVSPRLRAGGRRRTWYRLGPSVMTADGLHATLTWRPSAVDAVFSSFTGTLAVTTTSPSPALTLTGVTTGGEANVNQQVIRQLLELLVSAAGAQPSP